MSAKHTPGPWTDADSSGVRDGYVWAGGEIIASTLDHERGLVDARLIAAAPDMLAALEALWLVVNKLKPIGKYPGAFEALEQGSAAIAKARAPAPADDHATFLYPAHMDDAP